jgi:SAM-dependent methyltransferase
MLDLIQKARGYKLNAGALDDLRAAGVPGPIVDELQPLQDRKFGSKAQLMVALQGCGDEVARRPYVGRIVASARVLRPLRILRYIGSYWEEFAARSRLVRPPWNYLMLRPFFLALWLRGRWWAFAALAKARGKPPIGQASNANVEGFAHNRKQVLSFLEGHRNRTESLMNVLRAIQGVDFAKARVLCVGPRNEAEVRLLHLYGFDRKNVEAIDLFSYSPLIRLMDMNSLEYGDDSFDIYYSSAVIKYSPDIRRTISESLRVTRSGGLMAFGFMYGDPGSLIPTGSELNGGVRELLGLYGTHVEHVFWHDEFPYAPGDTRAAVIFRIRK